MTGPPAGRGRLAPAGALFLHWGCFGRRSAVPAAEAQPAAATVDQHRFPIMGFGPGNRRRRRASTRTPEALAAVDSQADAVTSSVLERAPQAFARVVSSQPDAGLRLRTGHSSTRATQHLNAMLRRGVRRPFATFFPGIGVAGHLGLRCGGPQRRQAFGGDGS